MALSFAVGAGGRSVPATANRRRMQQRHTCQLFTGDFPEDADICGLVGRVVKMHSAVGPGRVVLGGQAHTIEEFTERLVSIDFAYVVVYHRQNQELSCPARLGIVRRRAEVSTYSTGQRSLSPSNPAQNTFLTINGNPKMCGAFSTMLATTPTHRQCITTRYRKANHSAAPAVRG